MRGEKGLVSAQVFVEKVQSLYKSGALYGIEAELRAQFATADVSTYGTIFSGAEKRIEWLTIEAFLKRKAAALPEPQRAPILKGIEELGRVPYGSREYRGRLHTVNRALGIV